jgi:hypothetical protein
MADIAAVFHWSPAELDAMPVEEIFMWQRLAVARWNSMNGKGA